jgi:nucleotide-binding universal stress UspA family protein
VSGGIAKDTDPDPTMFEHIAVALDLSPASDSMLRCLPRLREVGAHTLTLIHVAEVDYPVFGAIADIDRHRERLATAARTLEADGFAVNLVAIAGNPAVEILNAAREHGASAVMIGSRSHSRVREAFVGSVATEVVRRAKLPVLVQRIEPETDDAPPEVRCFNRETEVLFPTDFFDTAERALPLVESLAREGLRSFILLHVASDGDADAAVARDRLDALAERLQAAGAGAMRVEVTGGSPADEILRLAGSRPEVLTVMGTHGRGRAASAVLGSVSREIVRKAAGSVLLAPPRE